MNDPAPPYFTAMTNVRDLQPTALTRLGNDLMVSSPDSNWRALGGHLGFSIGDLDVIGFLLQPGFEMLRRWMTRQGSTVNVLRSSLIAIGRHDLVEVLDDILWSETRSFYIGRNFVL